MNESLRRALLRARLSEEDVAARLEVDPKTVRRWLEGRVPYLRHRWVLASMLGLDEADLWPQLVRSRSWPKGVRAIYPHREDVPRETWLRLFSAARERIDILGTNSRFFLTSDPDVFAILADRAVARVKERICLCEADPLEVGSRESHRRPPGPAKDAFARVGSLRQCGDVEIRVCSKQLSNSIYRSDGESIVAPGIYGIPTPRIPVLHLRATRGGDLFESYLKGFEDIWASAYSP